MAMAFRTCLVIIEFQVDRGRLRGHSRYKLSNISELHKQVKARSKSSLSELPHFPCFRNINQSVEIWVLGHVSILTLAHDGYITPLV